MKWRPVFHDLLLYVVVYKLETLAGHMTREAIGMFQLGVHSMVLLELHFAFIPEAWGRLTVAAGKAFLAWLWKTFSTVQRVFGQIVTTNKLSLRLAKEAGLEVFGLHPKSFMKNGILRDQVLVGASRPSM
jgi:RimJ/RimL family protein N-acetyltransferase